MRAILRGARWLLAIIPVLAVVVVVTGSSTWFLAGFAAAELLVFAGVRGLQGSALLDETASDDSDQL